MQDEFIKIPEIEDRKATVIQGNNAKLLVIIPDISSDEASRATLMSIITAMNLNAKTEVTYLFITESNIISILDLCKKVSLVILFGIDPEQISLNITPTYYRLFDLTRFKLIICHSIFDMNKDKNLKLKLWNIIKEIQL